MMLRYFVVDDSNRLRKVSQSAVRSLWNGSHGARALGASDDHELRVVTVLCDDAILPKKVYVLRVPLSGGMLTEAGRLALQAFARADCVTPEEAVRHHTAGWPADFFPQLAVALDVPVAHLSVPLAVGGPLLLAAAMHLSLSRAVRYLR